MGLAQGVATSANPSPTMKEPAPGGTPSVGDRVVVGGLGDVRENPLESTTASPGGQVGHTWAPVTLPAVVRVLEPAAAAGAEERPRLSSISMRILGGSTPSDAM